jgi:hypothetical protein
MRHRACRLYLPSHEHQVITFISSSFFLYEYLKLSLSIKIKISIFTFNCLKAILSESEVDFIFPCCLIGRSSGGVLGGHRNWATRMKVPF